LSSPWRSILAVAAAQGDRDRFVGGVRDLHPDRLQAIVDRELAGRVPHELQQEVQQPGLVDDDVGELREQVAHVLGAAQAGDPGVVLRVGAPEVGLVDPVGLLGHLAGQAEGLEHLDGAAVHPVRPADLQRAVGLLHDTGDDPGELRELSGQQQAGRTAADDEDVDLRGQGTLVRAAAFCGGADAGIAGTITLGEILHQTIPVDRPHGGNSPFRLTESRVPRFVDGRSRWTERRLKPALPRWMVVRRRP
jgi:hypothetical protein